MSVLGDGAAAADRSNLPPSSSESDRNVSCIDSGAITLYLLTLFGVAVAAATAAAGSPSAAAAAATEWPLLMAPAGGEALSVCRMLVSVTTFSVSTTVM